MLYILFREKMPFYTNFAFLYKKGRESTIPFLMVHCYPNSCYIETGMVKRITASHEKEGRT